ncbi:MAG TPA: flagellar hook-length control protein FliK [Deltaproteobacteria bacterium]|nr:flagellar hook-length control protein FliK [Deltaproteobacteria bacterium]HOI07484.1 flagellar hook-length control protein FliK [Deltaproteobacteria bacterium]
MALPLVNMLGLATGAVGVMGKVPGQGTAQGDFDSALAAALNGKTGPENPLSEVLKEDGTIDGEALKGLLGTPAGFLLFQFMTSLTEMGIPYADAKLLLGGGGSQVSDDALKTLLESHGVGGKELESILGNPELKARVKTMLGDSFKAVLEARAIKDGIDPAALMELAASDGGTIDELMTKLEGARQTVSAQAAAPADGDHKAAAGAHDPLMTLTTGLIMSSVSHTTNEIRSMVGQVLRKAGLAGLEGTKDAQAVSGNPETALEIAAMTETAESVLGMTKDELKTILFEADPAAREEAVQGATAKINAYLKSREGKTLSPEVVQALSLLKTAMSPAEFAGIDQALNLWSAGSAVPDLKMPIDREMYATLLKNLGSPDVQSRFDAQLKGVVDQLRQALPEQLGTTGGKVTLRLNPPMLGQVVVDMTLADGQLQATFKTDQPFTRDMLVQNMNILKEALADQGIKATQFSVSMSFDQKGQGDAYAALTGHEKGHHGFGHQGRGQEHGNRAFREEESAVYTQAAYNGLLDRGLDLFA